MATAMREDFGRVVSQVFHYSIDFLDVLGRGEFGTVYKGHDHNSDSTIAAKQVSLVHKPDGNKIVTDSTEVLLQLNGHDEYTENAEYILKVYEVKVYKMAMWIFMEYCDFGNLNCFFDVMWTRLDKEIQTKVKLMIQISKGISFLHSRNIVHRDIKPGNILVKVEGNQRAVVKLGDSGLSKVLDPDGLMCAMSSNVGSLAFRAPEFFSRFSPEARGQHDGSADIFASGLTFLAMLQAQPGRNLMPKAEGILEPSEKRMPIGILLASRMRQIRSQEITPTDAQDPDNLQNIIVLDSLLDNDFTMKVKNVIRGMTNTSPEKRPSPEEIETSLKTLVSSSGEEDTPHKNQEHEQSHDGPPN